MRAVTIGGGIGGLAAVIRSRVVSWRSLDVRQMEGAIKWFNNSKGYGFIGVETGTDVFTSGIVGDEYRTLQEGDPVSFELVQGPKGPQDANVVKIEGIE